MISSSTLRAEANRISTQRLPRAAITGALLAATANAIIFLVATGALGLAVEVQMGGPQSPVTPLTVVPVILMSAIPAALAAGLLWLLARFVARPFFVFQIVAAVLALLSLGGPLSLQVGPASKAVLGLMHIVAAVAIVGALRRAKQPAA